ncbi:MAG TPA: metallophosphoesterase family protein [Actinomycetota bacterium]
MATIAVLSDLHSNVEALDAVVAAARHRDATGFIVCGDLVGYGADPGAVLERVFDLPLRSVVAGNHDLAAVDRFSLDWFNDVAAEALRWTSEQLTPDARDTLARLEPREPSTEGLVVHGSVVEPASEYLMPGEDAAAARSFGHEPFDRCFFGHTHVPTMFEQREDGGVRSAPIRSEGRLTLTVGHRYLLNPGSVGQPRDGDPRAAFMILRDGTVEWVRVPYDAEAAGEKIREAGLPGVLADRLLVGR